jgi:hypothetical protein
MPLPAILDIPTDLECTSRRLTGFWIDFPTIKVTADSKVSHIFAIDVDIDAVPRIERARHMRPPHEGHLPRRYALPPLVIDKDT